MINTDKYKGHTKGDAITPDSWRIVGDNFVMNGESPSFRYIAYVQVKNEGEHTIVGFSDADANLIADTPLLLAEVEQLREQNKLMVDYFRFMRDGGFTDDDWRTVNEWIGDEEK